MAAVALAEAVIRVVDAGLFYDLDRHSDRAYRRLRAAWKAQERAEMAYRRVRDK